MAALPAGALSREAVVSTVNAGLGRFLQQIRLEPQIEKGEFRGFLVLELLPPSFWQDIDLKPGDVITGVNGQSVEQPKSAYEVFESLRSAKQLRVSVDRRGKAHELNFPIVGAPQPRRQKSTG